MPVQKNEAAFGVHVGTTGVAVVVAVAGTEPTDFPWRSPPHSPTVPVHPSTPSALDLPPMDPSRCTGYFLRSARSARVSDSGFAAEVRRENSSDFTSSSCEQ